MRRSDGTSPGQQTEQRRDRVENRDRGCAQQIGKPVDLAQHVPGGYEKAGPDQVGNPDLFHREVECHGSALEHDVLPPHAVEVIGGPQVMADVAPGDHDPLGRAGRSRRIDQIGRIFRTSPESPRVHRAEVLRIDEILRAGDGARQSRARPAGRRSAASVTQQCGPGVVEANRYAVERRIGIEGKPGRTGLGDGNLRDQQVEAALHPQARDLAWAQATPKQPARQSRRGGVDLGIAHGAGRRAQGDRIRKSRGRSGENLGQKFIPQEFGMHGPLQDCGRFVEPLWLRRIGNDPTQSSGIG